jgi:hypothetical protein
MGVYTDIVLTNKENKDCLYGLGFDLSIREMCLKDSFCKGKAKTMDLLAYETVRQIIESEIKKSGG